MKQEIELDLPEELIRQAEEMAAKRGITISELFEELFRKMVAEYKEEEQNNNINDTRTDQSI